MTCGTQPQNDLIKKELKLRESWIRGSPDSRTISFGRTVGLLRYKTEDFVAYPDGTLLAVEGKLGNTDM